VRNALSLAVAAVLAFCAVPASAEPLKLRYGAAYSTINSIYSLPIFVAQRQGFFAQENLDLEVIVPLPGGSERQITALHDDTVDITHVATPFLIKAALGGSDAVAITAEFANPIYSLVAMPEIKSFAELRGKLVGLADEAGSISISMRRLLAQHGLGAGDFRTKIIPGTPARLQCLQRGDCDAVPLGQPQDLAAAAAGFRVLGLSNDAAPDLIYTVTAARRSFAEAHKEAIVRYVRGLARSFRFIRDPANRPTVVRTIVAETKVPPEIAERTMALYLEPDRGVLPKQGEISMTGLANVIAMLGEAGTLRSPLPPPERFVELRYLRQAGIE
jgi:ABC-type nitrate/sulfonate/bicarbonate transport system substrate-binding protein